MPHHPPRPCRYPGCPNLVPVSEGYYCKQHVRKQQKIYDTSFRDKEHSKRYGGSWPTIRKMYISQHPLCEMCLQDGKATPSVLVHHKLPLREGGTNDWNNLQALCNHCHEIHHAKAGDRWTKVRQLPEG